MYDFLDRFLNIALPRTKDFRGISPKTFDEMGNITIGIKERTIFPETANEEIKDVFGFEVSVITSAKNKEEAGELLKLIGFPLQKSLSQRPTIWPKNQPKPELKRNLNFPAGLSEDVLFVEENTDT